MSYEIKKVKIPEVPSNGNCLFGSIANGLMHYYQNGRLDEKLKKGVFKDLCGLIRKQNKLDPKKAMSDSEIFRTTWNSLAEKPKKLQTELILLLRQYAVDVMRKSEEAKDKIFHLFKQEYEHYKKENEKNKKSDKKDEKKDVAKKDKKKDKFPKSKRTFTNEKFQKYFKTAANENYDDKKLKQNFDGAYYKIYLKEVVAKNKEWSETTPAEFLLDSLDFNLKITQTKDANSKNDFTYSPDLNKGNRDFISIEAREADNHYVSYYDKYDKIKPKKPEPKQTLNEPLQILENAVKEGSLESAAVFHTLNKIFNSRNPFYHEIDFLHANLKSNLIEESKIKEIISAFVRIYKEYQQADKQEREKKITQIKQFLSKINLTKEQSGKYEAKRKNSTPNPNWRKDVLPEKEKELPPAHKGSVFTGNAQDETLKELARFLINKYYARKKRFGFKPSEAIIRELSGFLRQQNIAIKHDNKPVLEQLNHALRKSSQWSKYALDDTAENREKINQIMLPEKRAEFLAKIIRTMIAKIPVHDIEQARALKHDLEAIIYPNRISGSGKCKEIRSFINSRNDTDRQICREIIKSYVNNNLETEVKQRKYIQQSQDRDTTIKQRKSNRSKKQNIEDFKKFIKKEKNKKRTSFFDSNQNPDEKIYDRFARACTANVIPMVEAIPTRAEEPPQYRITFHNLDNDGQHIIMRFKVTHEFDGRHVHGMISEALSSAADDYHALTLCLLMISIVNRRIDISKLPTKTQQTLKACKDYFKPDLELGLSTEAKDYSLQYHKVFNELTHEHGRTNQPRSQHPLMQSPQSAQQAVPRGQPIYEQPSN